MDARRFDSTIKKFSMSRRSTVGAILASAFALLLTHVNDDRAAASCKKVGRNCFRNSDCCDGARCKGGANSKCRCKSGFADCDGDDLCESLASNQSNCGACGVACDADATCCDSVCVDFQSDPSNCGECGAACNSGEACAAGRCITCLPTAPLCGARCCAADSCCLGACTDLQTSRVNCGRCFNLCDFDEACLDGICSRLV